MSAERSGELRELRLDLLDPHPRNPRRELGDLRELAASIRALGVLEPIVATPRGERFSVVMGGRRVGAARLAGLATVPSIVRDYTDDEAAIAALVENVQRRDLSPLEEAAAFAETLTAAALSQRELARRIGKSQPFVANRVRLLGLASAARDALIRRRITPAAALETLRVRDPELVARLPLREGVSVLELRAAVDALLRKPRRRRARIASRPPARASRPRPEPTTRRVVVPIGLLARLERELDLEGAEAVVRAIRLALRSRRR